MMTTENKSEVSAEHFDRVVQGALSVGAQVVRIVGLVVIFRGRQFSVTSTLGESTGYVAAMPEKSVFVAYTTADDGYESIEVWREGSTIMDALEAAMDEVSRIEGAE
jgi:hypothetical protein